MLILDYLRMYGSASVEELGSYFFENFNFHYGYKNLKDVLRKARVDDINVFVCKDGEYYINKKNTKLCELVDEMNSELTQDIS